jgi:hypothetical protein
VPISRTARAAGWLTLALSAVTAPAASADEPAFTIGSRPAWVLLGGLTTGGTVALADRGALVGGELSLARLRDAQFAGVYADAYYDWGAHGTYVTSGLELGHSFLGLDGGIALRFADQTNVGVAARVTVGLGVAGLYLRYAHFGGAMDGEKDVLQLGLVLKLPVWTGGDR